ncbi:MAG TPA: alpha/beta hydrolase, partial [Candidatus Thermoplasmatota archaeon]|nr:alpha/beta hydrolase [Candidatus Thermoplasmatota archaeon]
MASADGTRLDVWRSGRGPPLVLVHGATADHSRWDAVRGPLEERFTLHAMDRRDRREGEQRPYAFEREVEDLVAVVDAAGGEAAAVVAHSFGAMCALEAAARGARVSRLVLYEGGFTSSDRPEWLPVLGQMERHIAEGRREEALDLLMRRIAMLSERDLDVVRRSPTWQKRLAAVHTIPRELRAAMAYRLPSDVGARVRVPTLLLVGGASPPSEHADAERVAKA